MSTVSPPKLPAEMETLYTPLQVRLASFIGGPLAAIYTLHSNFKRLGKIREALLTLYYGGAFVIVLLGVMPFLPAKFPNFIVPLAYSIAAGSIAASKQLSKEAMVASGRFVRRSGWNVAGVSLISLVSFCAILIPLLFAMDYWGIISLGK